MAEIITGKITDPRYMISNKNEQLMEFRLGGHDVLVFPKSLEQHKKRLEKAYHTGKTISIQVNESTTYRLFGGFAESPAKQKKAQFKKAYGLVREVQRYQMAILSLEDYCSGFTDIPEIRFLSALRDKTEKDLRELAYSDKALITYLESDRSEDRYESKGWLRNRTPKHYREYREDLWHDEDEDFYDDYDDYEDEYYYEDDEDEYYYEEHDILIKERITLTCDGLYVVRMYRRMYPNDTYQSVFSRYPLFYGCAPKMTDEIPF